MEQHGVNVNELVNLLGQKEIRIYELTRDLVALDEKHQKLQKAFQELIGKSSEAKPAPVLPFPEVPVNPVELEKVE